MPYQRKEEKNKGRMGVRKKEKEGVHLNKIINKPVFKLKFLGIFNFKSLKHLSPLRLSSAFFSYSLHTLK